MVADQHGLAHREIGAQATGRVREHYGARTRRASGADRVHDVAQVVALVGVNPADEHQHAVVPDPHRQRLAAMPGRGRRVETRQLGHRHHRDRGAELVDGRCPSRPENHGDVVLADPGAVADGGRRFGCYRIRSGHSARA